MISPTRSSLALVLLFSGTAACGEGGAEPPSDAISRELFIRTYVELRVAALQHPSQDIALEDRDRILEERGVTQQDLLDFIDVHGDEVHYMKDLWEEAEGLIKGKRESKGTIARPGSGSPPGS